MKMKRTMIVGAIGSGKTYLAKNLSRRLSVEYVDLDELYWLPGWRERTREDFEMLIENEISKSQWILCGNYFFVLPTILANVDTVIWLDYPLWICFWRCFKRTMRRILKREKFCNGNYETFGGAFLSKDSILLRLVRSYGCRKKRYEKLIRDPRYKKIRFFRFVSQSKLNSWLKGLGIKNESDVENRT